MTQLPRPKLELPAFITVVNADAANSKVLRETTLWPGVPASGRQSVYEHSEKNYTPPNVSTFDVWGDENVIKCKAKVDELYKQAVESGNFETWKKEKSRLRNNIKAAKMRHKLQTEFPAECMMPFYCDSCDRGFMTKDEIEAHRKTHVKCNRNGCPFVGHPKVVHLHMKMQHMTGLASKIMNIKTKEDIEKWRKERKRKFPTAANIAEKAEIEAEKLARGNVLKTKEFGKFSRGKKKCRSHHRKGKQLSNQPHKTEIKKEVRNEVHFDDESSSDNEEISCHGISTFHGVSDLTSDGSNDQFQNSDSSMSSDSEPEDLMNTRKHFEGHCKVEKTISEMNVDNKSNFDNMEAINESLDNLDGSIIDERTAKIHCDVSSLNDVKNSDKSDIAEHTTEEPRNAEPEKNSVKSDVNKQKQGTEEQWKMECEKNKGVLAELENQQCEYQNNVSDPMAILLNADSDSGEDNEAPLEMPIARVACSGGIDATEVGGALGSLMASYDISSDDDAVEDNNNDLVSEKVLEKEINSKKSAANKTKGFLKRINAGRMWNPNNCRQKMNMSKSSLLEKMLAPEIRKERNIMLQCVQYIVKKNYFGYE